MYEKERFFYKFFNISELFLLNSLNKFHILLIHISF